MWRPQLNNSKQLKEEAMSIIVDAKLLSLGKQNSGFCNYYSFVDANKKKMLWKQNCWGSKHNNFEDTKIYIVHVQKKSTLFDDTYMYALP